MDQSKLDAIPKPKFRPAWYTGESDDVRVWVEVREKTPTCFVEYDGVTRSLSKWAQCFGIDTKVLKDKLNDRRPSQVFEDPPQ